MDDFLTLLPVMAGVTSVVFAIYSTIEAIYALRAKDRIRSELERLSKVDVEIRKFRSLAEHHKLTSAEVGTALELIEETLGKMNERDKKFVERGLRQPSRLGVERYVNDLLTHA